MDLYFTVIWGGKTLLLINIIYLLLIVKHLTRPMIVLLVLLIGIFCLEITIAYFAHHNQANVHLTHFYTSGQFLLISVVYYKQLKKFKKIIPFGVILYSSILLYQIIDSKIVYDEFNTSGFLVSACLMMGYAFFYYIEHIREKRYWDTFNVGLFLYLGGSSIIFLTINSWKNLEGWNMFIWTINGGLIILYQGFITATIYRFHRVQKNRNGISSI